MPRTMRLFRLFVPTHSATLCLLMLFVFSCPSRAQVNPNFWGASDEVDAVALSGNRLYVAGVFSYLGPTTGAFAALDELTGAVDPIAAQVDGVVRAVAPDGLGGWYIGGNFQRVSGVWRPSLAHIRPDGTLDDWNPGAYYPSSSFTVRALAVNGSTVYVGGDFTTIGGQPRDRIAALDASTGIPTDWNPGASSAVSVVAVNGNTVYVGGSFTTIGGQPRDRIAALDASTGVPTDWNPGASSTVNALVVNGSTVYVGGSFTTIGGQPRDRIAALDATTALATPWNPGVGGGNFGPNRGVRALAIREGRVWIGGGFTCTGGRALRNIGAIDVTTGKATSWSPWNPEETGFASLVAVDDSVVYVGGGFARIGGEPRNNLAAIDAATGLATNWDPMVDGYVWSVVPNGDVVYLSGDFTQAGGQVRNGLAAVNATTGLAIDWNPETNGYVSAIAIRGSVVYLGGSFTQVGGLPRNHLAAVDAATGLVTDWNPGIGDGYSVQYILIAGDILYAHGDFTEVAGQQRQGLVGVGAMTGAVTAWNPGVNGTVYGMAAWGGMVYAAGDFWYIGGEPRNCIAALDVTTGHATGWNPQLDGAYVVGMTVDGGAVYAGGWFFHSGSQLVSNLAQISIPTLAAPPREPIAKGPVLLANGPNPTATVVQIGFELPRETHVRIWVMDTMGRKVAAITDAAYPVGRHAVAWDGMLKQGRAPAGIYFIRMEADGQSLGRKVVLAR